LSHEIGSIVELPRDVDVIQSFDRPVKTSCGYVHMAKNAKSHTENFFWQSKPVVGLGLGGPEASLKKGAL